MLARGSLSTCFLYFETLILVFLIFLSIKFLDNLFSKIGFIVGVIEVDIGESFFFDILILEKTDSCNLDMTGEKL